MGANQNNKKKTANVAAITMASPSTDLGQVVARVSERVENQGREIGDIRSNMNTGFANTNANFQALSNELRAQTAALNNTIAERNKTPWGILISAGVLILAIVGGLGTMAVKPIMDNQFELAQTMKDMMSVMVTRSEMDWRTTRGMEDRGRIERMINGIEDDFLPLKVWEERNHSRDLEVQNIQKQIDQNRLDFQNFASSLGNGRDFIQDLKEEQARLRDQLSEMRARMYASPNTLN